MVYRVVLWLVWGMLGWARLARLLSDIWGMFALLIFYISGDNYPGWDKWFPQFPLNVISSIFSVPQSLMAADKVTPQKTLISKGPTIASLVEVPGTVFHLYLLFCIYSSKDSLSKLEPWAPIAQAFWNLRQNMRMRKMERSRASIAKATDE